MNITEANIEEWKKVKELYLNLLKSDPQAFVDEYKEISILKDDTWIKSLKSQNSKTFVGIEDDNFIGMCIITFYKESPNIPIIHRLGVLSDYRNKGIAKKLMASAENWAKSKEVKESRLYVIANNIKAIEFNFIFFFLEMQEHLSNLHSLHFPLFYHLFFQLKF